jgi:predicted TIM-barrel fold metal-dependent hydrolase
MDVNDLVIVSVDDHVIEPPTMWDQHLSAQHRAIKPQMKKRPNGSDYWVFDGQIVSGGGLNAVAGRVREEYGMEPSCLEEMRDGAWDIRSRIDDMNVNGILASLNFPSIPTFDGSMFKALPHQDVALILMRAYNDWHIDEWCGSFPGRNIPMAIIPYWNLPAAVEEIRRVAAKGCHAITMSDNPSLKGCPSIHDPHWEPLWKVCAENDVVINIHIGSGAQAPHASMQSPIDCWIITMPISIVNSAADWLFLAALDRYPNLKISLSEGGIGWIPYFLERADFSYEHHHKWTHSDFGAGRKPSDRFREHFLTCFIDDKFGLKNVEDIGVDNIAYECDYPHSDTLWPQAPERLWETVKHLPREAIDKISHGNALRILNFDAIGKVGGRQACTVAALRAQAKHVDLTERSFGGGSPLKPGEKPRVVTSADVTAMFAEMSKA